MKASKWLLGILVLAGAGGAAWYFLAGNAKKVEYVTAKLTRGDIESVVSATGSCNAVVSVQVGSQVSGNILELHADYNTKVSRGQLVAVIDPAPFQARVDQGRANVENARAAVMNAQSQLKKSDADIATANANVANQRANIVRAQSAVTDAKTKLARRQELFDQKVASREDRDTAQATYDQAVANLEAAQAQLTAAQSNLESSKAQQEVIRAQLVSAQSQVKQQEANLQQALLDLEHTKIRAPVDGTVIARNMDVGQTVAASFSAPTIFNIAQDLTKMQVDANIDESDISRIQLGQQASFTVDAYPGQTFRGEVMQVRRAPINVQNVITYVVVIGVDNPDLKLFPGMTANVRILTDRVSNVLRLPTSAMRVRLENVPVEELNRDAFKNFNKEAPSEESKTDPSKGAESKTGGDVIARTDGKSRDRNRSRVDVPGQQRNGGDGGGGYSGDGRRRFGGEDGADPVVESKGGFSGRGGDAQGGGAFAGRGGFGGNGGGNGGIGGGRGGRGGRGGGAQVATVYILGEDGKPKGERVLLGIGDGGFVQVRSPNLREGMTVITGVLGQTPAAQAPGFPGGGRGKGGFKGGFF